MVAWRKSLLPPYLIHHGIQQGSEPRNISHIHVIRTIRMRLISTIVPTGALSEKVQVLEQIFAGLQTFRAILHIELLRCNTVNTNEIDLFAELRIGFTRLVRTLGGAPIHPPPHIFRVGVMRMRHIIIHTH